MTRKCNLLIDLKNENFYDFSQGSEKFKTMTFFILVTTTTQVHVCHKKLHIYGFKSEISSLSTSVFSFLTLNTYNQYV